jgi:hypothetical protein
MYYPFVNERVRMGDRADEFMVFGVDHFAWVADIHLLSDPKAIENRVPFRLLFAAGGFGSAPAMANNWEGWLAASRQVVVTSREQIDRGLVILADIQNSCSTTLKAILTSRQLIAASDRVIARARTLDCDETGDGSNT